MRSQPSGVEPERSTKIIGDCKYSKLVQHDKMSVNSDSSNLRYLNSWPIGRRTACSSPWHAVGAGCKMICCFILPACFTHFNLNRLGSTLKLARQGACVRWSHLMSVPGFRYTCGQHDPKTFQNNRPAPVITGVLITISSPNGASASNFQISNSI